ncbi:MAG: hypothetical protein WDW36_002251 [Sanguina aurantia]
MEKPMLGTSALKQYYIAVQIDTKLVTLLELLTALQHGQSRRPLAVCCSSRDSLDAVVYGLLHCRTFSVSVLHSDMSESEREQQLLSFRKASGLRTEAVAASTDDGQGGQDPSTGTGSSPSIPHTATTPQTPATSSPAANTPSSQGPARPAAPSLGPDCAAAMVLVTTDVCLRSISKDSLPLGVPLVVQYDLPFKKEVYTRRLSTMFGGGKERRAHRSIVIDFVVAGELASFRATERMSGLIQELPVHAADIFESG